MCIYIKAGEGKKFELTELGEQDPRIRAKFQDDYKNKKQYEYKVPEKWILQGLVKEVDSGNTQR